MALPYHDDDEFDHRRGSYSPEEAIEPVRRIKSSVNGDGMVAFDNMNQMHGSNLSQRSATIWEHMLRKAESLKQYLIGKGLTFLRDVPTKVFLLVGILILLLLIILLITLIVWAIRSAKGGASGTKTLHMHRVHTIWPHVEEDHLVALPLVSSNAFLPPNISLCEGFGFSCTNLPSLIIGTSQRCDGVADCPDGSDEIGCKVCQTMFSCVAKASSSSSPSTTKIPGLLCLRASSLCDGVEDCADKSDEQKYCRKECVGDEMKCKSSSTMMDICVADEMQCDGDVQCANADDELNCHGKCRGGAKWCQITQRCIPKWQLCDGIINCADGSDESNCNCKQCCGSGKALCEQSKICLDRSRVCDGRVDCPNADDERQCPGSCAKLSSDYISEKEAIVCNDGKRYTRKHACSGLMRQCERQCLGICDSELAFTCNNRRCVPRSAICDGRNDCEDGSDEQNCDCDVMRKQGDVIQCGTSSYHSIHKCIPAWRRCDGYEDCPGGEDEEHCESCTANPHAIYCSITRSCLPSTKRCDGFEDCPNGIDEQNCTCEECNKQPYPMYKCKGSERCFPRSRVCTPFTQCPQASANDKLFCAIKARQSHYGHL